MPSGMSAVGTAVTRSETPMSEPTINVPGWEPKHLSFSTLSTYRDCGKRLFLQKVLGKEQRTGRAALGGNALHASSEAIAQLIWEHGFEALEASAATEVDNQSNDGIPDEPGF